MNLRISGLMFETLHHHLFPGDGLEAIAFGLCGTFQKGGERWLLVHKIYEIPHHLCERSENRVTWLTYLLDPIFEEAERGGFSIVKFHCHPGGFNSFSEYDDASDNSIFDTIYAWGGIDGPHASIVVLPDGNMFGREVQPDLSFRDLRRITVAGNSPNFIHTSREPALFEGFELRNRQAFGDETVRILRSLKIAVIGCSGTGSPVIEQLVRLGVGQIVLVDPDHVEDKNLNRIVGTNKRDADAQRLKVEVLKEHIERIGLGTKVHSYATNLYDSKAALEEVISSDILFGCVDSIDGRHLLNHISTFYLIPYIDLGVSLKADGENGISEILGGIHFIQPGSSSLLTRGVYTNEMLGASSMKREMPKEYENQLDDGYLKNAEVESPAVISVNMLIASFGVNELLARLHPFRNCDNAEYSATHVNLTEWEILPAQEAAEKDKYLAKYVGRGNMRPLMNLTNLEPQ